MLHVVQHVVMYMLHVVQHVVKVLHAPLYMLYIYRLHVQHDVQVLHVPCTTCRWRGDSANIIMRLHVEVRLLARQSV